MCEITINAKHQVSLSSILADGIIGVIGVGKHEKLAANVTFTFQVTYL